MLPPFILLTTKAASGSCWVPRNSIKPIILVDNTPPFLFPPSTAAELMLSNNSSVDTEGQQPRPCKKRRLSLSRMTTTEDCEQTQRKSHFLYDIDMFVIGEDLLALPSAVEARVPGNGASIQARSEVDSREGTTQLSKKRPHSEISTDDDLRDDLRADLHLMEPGHVLVLGTSSVALIGDHDDNTPPTEPVTADSDSEGTVLYASRNRCCSQKCIRSYLRA